MALRFSHLQKGLTLLAQGHTSYVIYRIQRRFRALFGTDSHTVHGLDTLKSQLGTATPKKSWAIVLHLFYPELLDEFLSHEFFRQFRPDFFISVPEDMPDEELKKIREILPEARFYKTPNRGRDVAPFLRILADVQSYEWICKVHSKRSTSFREGELWRKDIWSSLLSGDIESQLQPHVDMLAPKHTLLPTDVFIGGNQAKLSELRRRLGLSSTSSRFIAGTMFWVRPQFLKRLISVGIDFEDEPIPRDGAWAHAFERVFVDVVSHERGRVGSTH